MKRFALALAGALVASAALAAQPVVLKPEPLDGDGAVTLGDLFEGAGAASGGFVATGPKAGGSVVLEAARVQAAARAAGLAWANPAGLRRIVVRSSPAGAAPGNSAAAAAEMLTYARSLSAGEVLSAEDLVWAPAARGPADAPRDADAAIGLAVRKPVRAGAAVSARDLGTARVIAKDDAVTVHYRQGGITLAMKGKALSGAAAGETVRVLNPQSKTIVEAVAAAPGLAVVGAQADALKAARSSPPRPPLRTLPMRTLPLIALAALPLAACSAVGSSLEAARTPQFTPVAYPAPLVGHVQPVAMVQAQQPSGPNSLWKAGARAFFKDQRATRVGDILTVAIEIDDSAEVDNAITRSRDNEMSGGVTNLLGLESSLGRVLPGGFDPKKALGFGGESSASGDGQIKRAEKINLTIAAVVTHVLPNGNMMIQGRQEVRTNQELRELTVAGIVRPEDITARNTINHTQIAEARISYGGRGPLTRSGQMPTGQAVMERLSPF